MQQSIKRSEMLTGSTKQSAAAASKLGSTGGMSVVGNNTSKRAQSAQKAGVLGLSEFNRIKASIAETGKASTLQEDRAKLKEASENRTKNWSNTILAIRKKKEQDKYEKFEREELERRRIDQEEAEYQAKVKSGVMNKAKKQIFERHDKVKTLHSKMLLSDALQERELQIQIEQQKKKLQEEIAKEHYEAILQQCADHDAKEEEKRKQLEAKKLHTQEVLRQQHEEFREKHIVRLMEDRLEGEIIKHKAKEAELEAIKTEELKRQRVKAAQAETMKGNMVLQEIRRKEKEKEALEDEKIKEYERQRDEKVQKRKEELERRFNERQRIRQQMIDKAVRDLQMKNDKESERLKKDIEDRRVREEFIEKEKREKIQKLKDTIDHHRDLYMRDRAIKKDRDAQEDKNFQQFWKDKNKTIEQNLREEKQNRFNMNQQLSEFQRKQAEEKSLQREQDLMREMAEAKMIQDAIDNDEKMFNTYAKRCLDEWHDQGKNITPILIELKKQKMQNLSTL